jgi:hypothetical protein
MADVDISKFRAQVVRDGFRPSNPGFVESEGQNPVDPAGSGQNHLPVTIGTPANGLAVTESQVLTIDKAQIFAGTSSQFVKGDGTLDSNTYLTTGSAAATYVPYTGAITDVNLGANSLAAEAGFFDNNGSSDALTVTHTSGSGYGIIVTKGGNNEALYVEKTSGSGNAMRVLGGRTSLVDLALSSVTNTAGDFLTISGGVVHKRTAAEVRTDIGAGTGNGTVTSVAALTLGTSGTDLSSTVANGTTTPVITLNVPTASASNRGALSAADWSTFNGKQNALTNPVTGTGTTNYLPKFTGATTIGNSQVFDDGTNVGIGITAQSDAKLYVQGALNIPAARLLRQGSYGTVIEIGRQGISIGASIGYPTDDTFSILTGGSERARITSGGNLLVGTTTDAGFKLDVNGTGRFSGNGFFGNATAFAGLAGGISVNGSTNSGINFRIADVLRGYVYVTGAGAMVLESTSGNIILSPNGNPSLTIASTGAATFNQNGGSFLIDTSGQFISKQNLDVATAGGRFTGQSARGTMGYIQIDQVTTGADGGRITFLVSPSGSTTPVEAMRIISGGNVLIGTQTSGSSKLRIVGLPTSAAGLSSGDVYNLSGVLMIA